VSAGRSQAGQRAARVVIGVGLLAACAGLLLILTESKPRQAGSNYVREDTLIARLPPAARACQRNEGVPADAARLRLLVGTFGRPLPTLRISLLAFNAPPLSATLRGGGKEGHVSLPIPTARDATPRTTICIENAGDHPVALFGGASADPLRVAGRATPGRARFEWLREGRESWIALAPTLARRIGYAKENPFGRALLPLAAILVLASWALAIASIWRAARTPYLCAAAAITGCLAWAQLTPPFQVPDETVHFSYAQYLAETGKAPSSPSAPPLSPQQGATMDALRTNVIIGNARNRSPLTQAESSVVARAGKAPASAVGGGLNEASSQPPLYYLMEAAAYRLSPATSVVGRLLAMRLLSSLLAGLTAAFIFLFLREALPRHPWAWSVGALVAAFQPILGFISSGVNSDALLFCASAALFWALACAFTRGLDRRTAIAIGAALVVGTLAKLTFLGLVPGALVALALLVLRMPAQRRAAAARSAGLALAIAAVPVAVYVAANVLVWNRPAVAASLQGVASAAGSAGEAATVGSWREQLGYVWQLYLPRLPFMFDQFTDFPLRTVWLNGLAGSFGWLDYSFRPWVYNVSQWVAITGAVLFAVGAARMRTALTRRRQELLCYVIAAVGLLTVIGLLGIRYRATTGVFEQARYLLPLLALYGAVVAVSALALGRRFAPALGAAIVLLAMFHSLAAQLLTISRYYG